MIFGVASLLAAATPSSRALGGPPPGDEAVDVLKVVDDRVYHLDEALGLQIYDVSDIDHPRLAGRHPIVGWPLGVAVHENVATIVMRTQDNLPLSQGATSGLVQAVDVRDPARPRILGQSALEGSVREARATRNALYILSEKHDSTGPHVVLTSVRLDGIRPGAAISTRRDGFNGALRVAGGRIVLAYANPDSTGTRVELLADSVTAFSPQGSLGLEATIGAGDPDVSARLYVTDPTRVRVIGCPTVRCPTGALLEIATLDTTTSPPRVTSRRRVASPGTELTTRFDGDRLYLASQGRVSSGSPPSLVSVVDLEASSSAIVGRVPVHGIPRNLVLDGPRLLAIGTRGDEGSERADLYVDSLDVRDPAHPVLAGEVVIGDGWTWSPAVASTQAVAVDSNMIAVPFDTFDPEADHSSARPGIAILDAASGVPRISAQVWSNAPADRVVAFHGRLLVATTYGLTSIDVARLRTATSGRVVTKDR